MGKVKSTVTINTRKVSQLANAQIMALEQTAGKLIDEVREAQVMPRDTGRLQGDATSLDRSRSAGGTVAIVTQTPYARRLYFHPEYNFQKKKNPNAQGKWLEPWISGSEKDFCQKEFTRRFKQIGGV